MAAAAADVAYCSRCQPLLASLADCTPQHSRCSYTVAADSLGCTAVFVEQELANAEAEADEKAVEESLEEGQSVVELEELANVAWGFVAAERHIVVRHESALE